MTLRIVRTLAALTALSLAESGAMPHPPPVRLASARITAGTLPYLPGSTISLALDGLQPPYSLDVVGSAAIDRGQLHVPQNPQGESATVIASNRTAIAMHRFTFASPPNPGTAFIAVAAYNTGVVIHDAQPPFTARSVLGIGGAPADVAIDPRGRLAAADTSGTTMTIASLRPWSVRVVDGVPVTDELAFDSPSGDFFATNRDVGGKGALTRVAPDANVTQRVLGITSEGIALDPRRHRAYIANTNDATISIVDTTTMRERARFHAIDRVFSLALSADATRLYAVSNQSITSPFAAAGSIVAFDVSRTPHVVARSGPLAFPVGVAFDRAHHRIFVSDERDDDVDVLDPLTLRPLRAPLRTCHTPWKLDVDERDHRLYVPCAQSDAIDVFDTRTLERVAGAPFATGGYPLSVAVWHPAENVVQ